MSLPPEDEETAVARREATRVSAFVAGLAPKTLRYGDDPAQLVDVYAAPGGANATIAVVHGGFWKRKWDRFATQTTSLVPFFLDRGFDVALIEYRPRDVSRVVKYWKRYLLAAAPVALLVAGLVVIITIHDDLTWSDAVYLAVITSTTVGYGDFSFGRSRGRLAEAGSLGTVLLSAYTILVVVVLANSIVELFAIWRRQRLRDEGVCDFGPSPKELEELLLDKYAALSPEDERAGAEPALSEADYVVATLVKADIVDDQILFAIRRNFHWDALAGATKFSTMITAEDVHALPKRPSRAQLWVPARLRGQGRAPPDDEPYDAWRARYWEPRLASRRAERRERSRELHSQSSVYSWAASGSFDDDGEAAV